MEGKLELENGLPNTANLAHELRGVKMLKIGSFALGQSHMESEMVEGAQKRLSEAGVPSYRIEVAGAGEPEVELDGATFTGQREINQAIDNYISHR